MNIERLKKVRDAIKADPSQFDMHSWVQYDEKSSCGTTSCIAGWAVHLFDTEYRKLYNETMKIEEETSRLYALERLNSRYPFSQKASLILDLDEDFSNWQSIFIASFWPVKWRNKYLTAFTSHDRAMVAVGYLDEIIKKGMKKV